jgi:hypothetical protein
VERPSRDRAEAAERPAAGLTPAIAEYQGTRMRQLRTARVWPMGFLLGTTLAALVVGTLVVLSGWLEHGYGLAGIPALAAREDRWQHVMAGLAFGLVLLAYLVLRQSATPALGISMLLVLLAASFGFITFQTSSPGAAMLAAVVLLLTAGIHKYKIRLGALERRPPTLAPGQPWPDYYRSPLAYPPAVPDRSARLPGLLRCQDRLGDQPRGQPLVVVCASGGGIRAATWTAAILGRLDALPGFRGAAFLVTGASGGMVGATFWVGALRREHRGGSPLGWEALTRVVARDSLTAVARALVFSDMPLSFLPGVNRADRGQALEDAWLRNARAGGGSGKTSAPDSLLDMTFGDLREGERQGRWPSLIFTPMLVEDGRRLVMSNLDFGPVLHNSATWIGATGKRPERGSSSMPAFHYDELFPGALAHLPVRTAARLSASFPYVSPAVALPTRPRRRVVDAGYYDNYGLNLMNGWLRQGLLCDRDFRQKIDRVLVIQIRDNVSPLSVNPTAAGTGSLHPNPADRVSDSGPSMDQRAEPRRPLNRLLTCLGRGLEGVTTPVTGLLAAREAVMLFRNDGELGALVPPDEDPPFVTTTIFDFKGEASTSWMLTQQEIAGICAQARAPGIEAKLADVARWLEPGVAQVLPAARARSDRR